MKSTLKLAVIIIMAAAFTGCASYKVVDKTTLNNKGVELSLDNKKLLKKNIEAGTVEANTAYELKDNQVVVVKNPLRLLKTLKKEVATQLGEPAVRVIDPPDTIHVKAEKKADYYSESGSHRYSRYCNCVECYNYRCSFYRRDVSVFTTLPCVGGRILYPSYGGYWGL